MKFLVTFACLLATASAAAVLQSRQSGITSPLTKQKALKLDQIKTTTSRTNAKRLRIRYGPYKLRSKDAPAVADPFYNGKSMDPAGTAWNHLADDDFPRDVTILTTNAQVVFEDGTRAEVSKGVYNHHLVFFNQDKSIPSVLSCDGQTARRGIPLSLFVGGSEDKGAQYFTTPDGKFNSGYYIGKKDRILMGGDVVNYTNKTQTVFAEVEVEYVDGKVAGLMETGQHSVSVGMCDGVAGTNLTAPKGQTKFTYTGKEITVFTDDYLVSARGHLHDGGVDVTMKLNGKEICDSKAEYGGAASTLKDGDKVWKTINQMTYCDGPVKMVKGDKLLLEAKYDLDEHAPRIQHNGGMAEEMALFAAYFAVGP